MDADCESERFIQCVVLSQKFPSWWVPVYVDAKRVFEKEGKDTLHLGFAGLLSLRAIPVVLGELNWLSRSRYDMKGLSDTSPSSCID